MNLQHKFVPMEIKDLTQDGSFTGYAAVFNNVDLGGDIIAPGAFSKTIQEKQNHPILWGHMTREVIGVNKSYQEDAKGLLVNGQLTLGVQRADEAHKLMKSGAVTGMSIGYDSVVDEYNYDTEIRTLKEVKLWEYSFTPFPMNPEAQLTSVKSFEQVERHLTQLMEYLRKHKGRFTAKQTAVLAFLEKEFMALRAAQAPVAAESDSPSPDLIHAGLSKCDSILSLITEA